MFLPSQIFVRDRHLESHDLDSKNRKKIFEKKIFVLMWYVKSYGTLGQ